MMTRSPLLGSTLLLVALLPACGGGSGSGSTDVANLETLSGRLVTPAGGPLTNARIEFEGSEAISDANGLFLLPSTGILPSGTYPLQIEGPMGFGTLQVPVEVLGGTTEVELSAPITIPDLVSFPAGSTTISLDPDGASLGPIALAGSLGDLAANGPDGTTVEVGDGTTPNSLSLAIAPLEADELSPNVPADRVVVSAAAIAPADSSFTTPAGAGLDLLLPNVEQLPLGTPVELLQFDNEEMAWVSRSAGLDPAPSVIELPGGALAISGAGLVRGGGLWAAVLDLEEECATTLAGRAVDSSGNGIEGIAVQTSTGQTAISNAAGDFELQDVPAYELSSGACLPRDVQVSLSAPVSQGGMSATPLTIPAGQIQIGNTTTLGDLQPEVTAVGCVAGLLLGADQASGSPVFIAGPTTTTVQPALDGSFFACGLQPGSYTASFTFPGDSAATTGAFEVAQGEIATIELERVLGGGSSSLQVTLLERSVGTPDSALPVSGAVLMLRGTDSVSANGLMATTDTSGIAVFQGVDGPFEVTAIAEELLSNGLVLRRATTVMGVDPADGLTTLLLDLDGNPLANESPLDARLSGGIANLPPDCSATLRVTGRDALGEQPAFSAVVTAPFGAYAFDVPSGQVLDLTVTLDCDPNVDGVELAGLSLAIAPLAFDEQRIVDVDVNGTEFFDLNSPASLSIAGASTSSTTTSTVQLLLSDSAAGTRLAPELLSVGPDLPGSVGLPNLGEPALSGLDRRLSLTVGSDSPFSALRESQSEVLQLDGASPTALQFDLLAVPQLSTPASTSDPVGLTFGLGTAALAPGEGGFDRLTLEGFGFQFEGGPANAIVCWDLVFPAGTTSVSLPPAAASILQPTNYEARLTTERLEGIAFTAIDLQAANAASALAAARENATRTRTSTIVGDLVITP